MWAVFASMIFQTYYTILLIIIRISGYKVFMLCTLFQHSVEAYDVTFQTTLAEILTRTVDAQWVVTPRPANSTILRTYKKVLKYVEMFDNDWQCFVFYGIL